MILRLKIFISNKNLSKFFQKLNWNRSLFFFGGEEVVQEKIKTVKFHNSKIYEIEIHFKVLLVNAEMLWNCQNFVKKICFWKNNQIYCPFLHDRHLHKFMWNKTGCIWFRLGTILTNDVITYYFVGAYIMYEAYLHSLYMQECIVFWQDLPEFGNHAD